MIIGICGFIGSGKDTIADYLVNLHQFRRESFANSLKDAVSQVFGWDRTMLEGRTKQAREWREQRDEWWSQRLNMDITPRWILQYWGTEVCRKAFHDDIWIASIGRKLIAAADTNFVIPDTRFPNEIDMIKQLNGQVWLIKRGNTPPWLSDYTTKGLKPIDIHPSEYMWANSAMDSEISNDGTIISEGIDANYLDIINYAAFALILIAEKQASK